MQSPTEVTSYDEPPSGSTAPQLDPQRSEATATQAPPLVGIVVADEQELTAIQSAMDLLDACMVPHEILIGSSRLMPDELRDWARTARKRGLQAIIAVGGLDPHLPSIISAHSILPVIGFPLTKRQEDEGEALRTIVQAPDGIPIATTGARNAVNAAVFAVQILARFDNRWETSILKYRMHLRQLFRSSADRVRQRHESFPTQGKVMPGELREDPGGPTTPEVLSPELQSGALRTKSLIPPTGRIPGSPTPPFASEAEPPPSPLSRPETEPPHTDKPGLKREARHVGRIAVDPEMIAVDVAEDATDCLLDGGIVAIPTDTVYGLAVDATNPDAVRALVELKGRDPDKPIAVFIESQRQLVSLVRNLTVEVKQMLEAFWPGPLTVVFERRGGDFDYLSQGNTIGLRLPNHSIALALLQELRRPIACTSANPSGAPPARSADEIEHYFGPEVHMILDAGKLPPAPPSTVVDVSTSPFRLLREGVITREQLTAVLGDLIESDDSDD